MVIDDAAVTPKYVQGFEPERELPIIWKIARGSMINKIVVLLPVTIGLNELAPAAMTPLLMVGGSYLCFEGAEKILHVVRPHHGEEHGEGHGAEHAAEPVVPICPEQLEEEKVRGAVKTDFILSAEIMAIALAAIPSSTIWVETAALALVGIGVTVAVYGAVALIIKMDDVGLALSTRENRPARVIGRGLVKGMPVLLKVLSVVGTGAMLWVGGSIVIHGLHELGLHHPYADIHHLAEAAAHGVPAAVSGFVGWFVTATCDGILGLLYGLLLIPLATRVLVPLWKLVRPVRKPREPLSSP